MTKYSVGFAFNERGTVLVLIKKKRPNWQFGLLNGVGGHVEDGESFHACMTREFKEETGVDTYESNWHMFAKMSGDKYEVAVFSFFNNEIIGAATHTDEEVVIVPVPEVVESNQFRLIPNLKWLIPAALAQRFYEPTLFIQADYGKDGR